jgi:hypothetical protein
MPVSVLAAILAAVPVIVDLAADVEPSFRWGDKGGPTRDRSMLIGYTFKDTASQNVLYTS